MPQKLSAIRTLSNLEIMDATNLSKLVGQLDDNIDDLEEALEPLIETALSDRASRLPVLDRAKLYVLVVYAIESILFCK
jgi:exosome complex protein LRP1